LHEPLRGLEFKGLLATTDGMRVAIHRGSKEIGVTCVKPDTQDLEAEEKRDG
jgi:hypothetical protein